jgi:hypothetical protein
VPTGDFPATTGPASAGGGNADIEADLNLPSHASPDRVRHERRRLLVRSDRRLTSPSSGMPARSG